MKKRAISVLLASSMLAVLFTGCGSKGADTDVETGTGSEAGEGTESGGGTYTYRATYTGVNTWSPTDWSLEGESELFGYASTNFYGFWMNEDKDGYDIVCELASEFPVDLTSQYAGSYGVPQDATEGYAWQVTMREDACWEDGTPISVEDVEYSLQQYLNPEMKNYRASTFFSGDSAVANAEAYYNNDRAGGVNYTIATDFELTMADLSAGEDGQYVDADGNKTYFAWSEPVDDWLGGYALTDYTDYMTEEVSTALASLANDDGYIPVTDESISALMEFTSSDDWGNETEEDLINYTFCEDGIVEEMPWEEVGFVRDGDYTFTLILKNPCSMFDFETGVDLLTLLNKELYEANKQETGGLIKSSYGTAVDKFSSYGAYKITNYQEDKEVDLVKNENWFGWNDTAYDGMYMTTNIQLLKIDEHTTALSMFLQGNLDEVSLSNDDMEKYGTSDYIYFTPQTYTYYLGVNTDFDMLKSRETDGINKTILTYLDFRKAMSLAIDRSDYVKSCTAGWPVAYGLLDDIYVYDPDSGETYRNTEEARKALCEVYGVSSVDELTGYDVEAAAQYLQAAYDQCYEDGNISDTDVVQINYHLAGSNATFQKMVDYIEDALLEAAKGTSLEDRIKINLLEDPDCYANLKSGQADMTLSNWGGEDLNPYAMMQFYTDPSYFVEYGFDYTQDLTISVQGKDVTMNFYDWYVELNDGAYAIADLSVRNEILAGIEKGLLLNYHVIPIASNTSPYLASQRTVYGSDEFINSIIERGGLQYMTYTMDDQEWADYCKEQNNNLSY